MANAKLQSNSSSVTPSASANVSPITSRSGLPSTEQDLIDPPNSSMINSNSNNSSSTNANVSALSTQNSVSSVSSSPLPGNLTKNDDDAKNALHSRSQSITQATESPQHQGKGGGGGQQGGDMQLKYENDRLKLALAQSSANAKKWEVRIFQITLYFINNY